MSFPCDDAPSFLTTKPPDMRKLPAFLILFFFLFSCTKQIKPSDDFTIQEGQAATRVSSTKTLFTKYTIRAGQHYCDQNTIKSVRTSEIKFMARFDNTAIYQTIDPLNQYDINKLWGFSEGFDHQYNSARIGWAYNDGALRLYAYAYNNGVREYQEITPVSIDADITCSIKLSGNTYLFTVNGITVSLPRASSSLTASGYQLYPYFGGDEVAPHTIYIWLRNL